MKPFKDEGEVKKALETMFPGSVRLVASRMQQRGLPDMMLNVDGRPVFCEIKVGRDKLTELQKRFLKRWNCSVLFETNGNKTNLTFFYSKNFGSYYAGDDILNKVKGYLTQWENNQLTVTYEGH